MTETRFQAPKRITVFPVKPAPVSLRSAQAVRRRVSAYARVSTKSDEQKTSYDAQVDYYTQYIKSNDDWEFGCVYTDRGISGTSTKGREGFNTMMRDAQNGKIDLIITKSVSRFARNTVDTLIAIRKLKEIGVEVFFEEQNIYTLDSKGEVLLTIMSSLAQDESRNISENITWGQRKRFADGKVSIPYGRFLGYRKGADGEPEIDPDEAVIVRRIFREFLQGKSPHMIAQGLKADGILTPSKKSVNWQANVVKNILSNEKYKGDALLQKTYTVDFLTKTMKKNEGEVPQYYVEGSHPAIIDADVFDQVQVELSNESNGYRSAVKIFSGKLYCANCGSIYGSKLWHSTDKYRREIWQCNAKFRNAEKCETPHLTEEEIKDAFVTAFNRCFSSRETAMANYRRILTELTDVDAIKATQAEAVAEHERILEKMERSIRLNAAVALDQQEFQEEYDKLLEDAAKAKDTIDRCARAIAEKARQRKKLLTVMAEIEKRDSLLTEFDDQLWIAVVEKVTVGEMTLTFRFKDGSETKVERGT